MTLWPLATAQFPRVPGTLLLGPPGSLPGLAPPRPARVSILTIVMLESGPGVHGLLLGASQTWLTYAWSPPGSHGLCKPLLVQTQSPRVPSSHSPHVCKPSQLPAWSLPTIWHFSPLPWPPSWPAFGSLWLRAPLCALRWPDSAPVQGQARSGTCGVFGAGQASGRRVTELAPSQSSRPPPRPSGNRSWRPAPSKSWMMIWTGCESTHSVLGLGFPPPTSPYPVPEPHLLSMGP